MSDFHLDGVYSQSLLERVTSGELHLWVPEVVVREAVRRFAEDLDEALGEARKGLTRLLDRRFGNSRHSAVESQLAEEVDERIAQYEQRLRDRLGAIGAKVVPVSEVLHDELLVRDLNRRKPFDKSGAGYRDALIWEAVLEVALDTNESVGFITANHKDFAESGDNHILHADLAAESVERGCEEGQIALYRTTRAFLEQRYQVDREALEELQRAGADDLDTRSALLEAIHAATSEFLDNELGDEFGDAAADLDEPTLTSIEGPTGLAVKSATVLSDREVILELSTVWRCSVDGFMTKADWYASPEDEALTVIDPDWNDYTVLLQREANIRFRYSVWFDRVAREVLDTDVVGGDIVT